jgi:hypothetical protein
MRGGMTRILLLSSALLGGLALPAAAQHPHHGHGAHAPPAPGAAQPYAGLEGRPIKALSDAQTAELLAGAGMGLALAAELNGYPGPLHVLEHAEALRLTPVQLATATALRNRMSGEARTIGARIVVLEQELDALFAGGAADPGRLAALTAAIGALNGRLREVHLAAHIGMRDALDVGQRSAYARLRGYPAPR